MHLDLPEKRYYSIGELAKAFSVNASLIRFWDKEFDVLKPKKNAKGNRMFTPEDVKNLQLIYHLVKERGFTLEGAKVHLKEGQKKTMDKFEIIRKLEAIKPRSSKQSHPFLKCEKPPVPFREEVFRYDFLYVCGFRLKYFFRLAV